MAFDHGWDKLPGISGTDSPFHLKAAISRGLSNVMADIAAGIFATPETQPEE